MKSLSRPRVEQLEDRCVPASWGNPWPDPGHLTVSFVPDGTAVGNHTSQLFQMLNKIAPTQQWETTILRALQTWADNANLSVGVVSDGGQALGSAGLPEGDPRLGDIRVAAVPMAGDVMAVTTPFDPTAGTWAGDIVFNSNYLFSLGGAGAPDLFTVALHESAHSFGLADNQDPTSVLFQSYQGPETGPSAGDITALQAIYGPRTPDQFEGTTGNATFATATPLNFLTNPDGSLGIKADADITTLSDVDMYRVQAPLNVGKLQIVLHTSGLSLLVPKLTVYDANHRVIQSVVSSGPQNGDLTVTVSGLLPLGTYYVQVQSGSQDVFGVGSYELQVKSIPLVNSLTGLLNSTVNTATQLVNSLPLNDTMLTATLLAPLTTQTPSRFDYAYQGNISSQSTVDYYRVLAPQSTASSTVLTVMVWGTGSSGLVPRADVYDASGNPVAANVLTNENGVFIVQVANAKPGAAYFVKISAADPKGTHNAGSYFLAAQFGGAAVQLDTITQGTLSASSPQQFGQLAISSSELFHFVLAADTGTTAAAGVRMTIYDQNGNVVATLSAFSGQPPTSITVALARGTYTIRFSGGTPDGSPLPAITYALRASRLSDPIGPQGDDTSNSPSTYGSTGSPTTTTTTGGDPSTTDSGSPTTPTGTDPGSTGDPTDDGNADPTDPSQTDPNASQTTDPNSSDSSNTTSTGTSTDPSTQNSTTPNYDDSSPSPYTYSYSTNSSVQPIDPSSNPYSLN